MHRVALLLALVGCNQVFDLTPTTKAPAPPPADAIDAVLDTDGDGIIDLDDNCRSIANPDQHDEDRDEFGDVCDNCPLIENGAQGDADHDLVGDACDPHPLVAGDCLLVFDSFADTAGFAAHWGLLRPNFEPATDIQPDHVKLTPKSTYAGALVSKDLMSGGPYSVQVTADLKLDQQSATFAVGTGLSPSVLASSGLQCELYANNPLDKPPFINAKVNGSGNSVQISGPPVDSHLLLRLAVPTTLPANINCRADYGFETGFEAFNATSFAPGNVGLVVYQDPVDVAGIAIYGVATSCPAAIVR